MKFLIIGLGSAGQRHARVLRNLYPTAQIDVFLKGRTFGLISADLKSVQEDISPLTHYRLNEVPSIPRQPNSYDLSIIATPVSSHCDYFHEVIESSKRVLVEKPIATTMSEAQLIATTALKSEKPVLVGYQHYFSPVTNWIKQTYRDRRNPQSIQMTFHEYLRDMNVFRDMDSHHLASTTGGGVLLALSHEIDLFLQLWSGDINELLCQFAYSEEFDGVLDAISISNVEKNGVDESPKIDIKLSFSRGDKNRSGKIVWDSEVAQWDYFTKSVSLLSEKEIKSSLEFDFHGDDLVAKQSEFLLQKQIFDADLKIRLLRAIEIVRWNEEFAARAKKSDILLPSKKEV